METGKYPYDDVVKAMAASGMYRVNADGRIETCRRWNGHKDILVDWYVCDRADGKGYLYVSDHGARVKAHRLAYCLQNPGRDLNGQEINHIHPERGTADNRDDNIELCGRHRQSQHAYDVGLNPCRGEQHHKSKLTVEGVREIRRRRQLGVTYARLARDFGVTPRTIELVCWRVTWRHVV